MSEVKPDSSQVKEEETKKEEAPEVEIPADLVSPEDKEKAPKKKRNNKKKPGQWRNAKQNTWIYIQNLPSDTTEDLLYDVFKRYGIIQQNLNGTPRIKLYRDENGKLKGDASICYLRKESIQLAIQMQDDCPLRYSDTTKVHVSEAVFERKNKRDKPASDDEDDKTKKLRWMHMQQQMHNLSWAEEDEDEGGIGLKIIVLQNMFSLQEAKKPNFKEELMSDVRSGCEPFGVVEKVTIFDTNPDGIVVVKFKSANAAENCVKRMDGRFFAGRQLKAFFWDGHTDYRTKMTDDEENEKLENFAKWIEEDCSVC
ncbi:hypothetical protein WA577_005402 [Blastocystis sp. JDR]